MGKLRDFRVNRAKMEISQVAEAVNEITARWGRDPADPGIDRTTIWRIESGESNPKLDTVIPLLAWAADVASKKRIPVKEQVQVWDLAPQLFRGAGFERKPARLVGRRRRRRRTASEEG